MNMLDAQARDKLQKELIHHFEPLGLKRFIIVGFTADGAGSICLIDFSGTAEKIAGLLRQIADGIQPETLFSLGN